MIYIGNREVMISDEREYEDEFDLIIFKKGRLTSSEELNDFQKLNFYLAIRLH